MEIDKRLQEIFDELHDKAYPFQEFHAYEFKQANQVIRKHFEKLLSEETMVREDTNQGVKLPLSKRCSLYNAEKELPTLAGIPNEVINEIKQLESQLEEKQILLGEFEKANNLLKTELQEAEVNSTTSLIEDKSDLFGSITVTACCQIGPIVNENYCPNCGREIDREETMVREDTNHNK